MSTSKKLAYAFGALVLLLESIRLFFDVPMQDEPYYGASALLTSIGGKPFASELSFQQTAYLLYEPWAALYYKLFGTFGYYLFVRQTFFVCLAAFAFLVFKFARKRTGDIVAIPIALITIACISIIIGSMSYNTIGALSLGAYALLSIEALRRQSNRLAVLAGFFSFTAVAAYPTMVIAIVVHGLVLSAISWRLRRPFVKLLAIAAACGAGLLALYAASLVLRFGWDDILLSYRYTTSISAMGSFWEKASYSWLLFSFYIPWLWVTIPAFLIWLWFWRTRGLSYSYLLVFLGVLMASGIRPPPEAGDWLQSFILLGAFLGAPLVWFSARENFKERWPEVALYITGIVGACVTCWTSGQTLYATNYAATLALLAVLILMYSKPASKAAMAALFCVLAVVMYDKYFRMFTSDEPVYVRTKMITWGPLAGFMTYQREYDHYRQIQNDINRAAQFGKSVVFYDAFASGYLMSDMRPATSAIISHMINQSYPVRQWAREFYENPANRPDVVVRFTKHLMPNAPFSWNVHPSQFEPAKDVFWYYLPEETGEYALAVEREHYSIYMKKSLFK